MALSALATWEAARDALHQIARVLGAATTIYGFARRSWCRARVKADWRAP